MDGLITQETLLEQARWITDAIVEGYKPLIEKAAERGDGKRLAELNYQMRTAIENNTGHIVKLLSVIPPPAIAMETRRADTPKSESVAKP